MSPPKRPRRATRAQVRTFPAAAGYGGTPPDELVDQYVDLVGAAGRPGLPRHRLAVHLTAQSLGWTAPPVDALEEAWREEQQVRARAAAQARDASGQDAARATAFIRDIWARTGTGPTWTELGEAMAWPPQLRARVIRLLARDGVLLYSSAPRSLAVVDGTDDE